MSIENQPAAGVLLLALGAAEYGNMAANLAASIRYSDPDVPIHLVHSGASISHLTPVHRALFSSMAECPAAFYTAGENTEYIKAKTHIYELSPFESTLFLDADMLLLPQAKLGEFIADLAARCDYTVENRGYADLSLPDEKLIPDYSNWCSIIDVKHHYNTGGRFYQLHSEFMFFKKNERNAAYFEKVHEVYDSRPVKYQVFDGGLPDEYAFDIATALTDQFPHQENYIIIYWHGMDGQKNWNKEVTGKYIGFSLGGNYIPDWIESKVESYKQLYRRHLKLPYLFRVPSKKRWNERRKML